MLKIYKGIVWVVVAYLLNNTFAFVLYIALLLDLINYQFYDVQYITPGVLRQ